jgi:hypothetical protein
MFYYTSLWSKTITWGGGNKIPEAGESIILKKNMVIIVDVDSTPILGDIIVFG